MKMWSAKIDHNPSFSEFSTTEAINLKKIADLFQDAIRFPSWPSAAQDIYIYLER